MSKTHVAHVYYIDANGRPRVGWDNWSGMKLGDKLYASPQSEQETDLAIELRRLHEVNAELFQLVKDLQESASYWSEYSVPLGIVDRINAAIQKATKEKE